MINYYETLGLDKNTTPEEIKKRYKELVLKYHPDKGGDETRFKRIQEAYEVLSDPKERLNYDENDRSTHHHKIMSAALIIFNQAADVHPENIREGLIEIHGHCVRKTNVLIGNLRTQLERVEKTRSRIKKAPAADFIGFALLEQKRSISEQISGLKEEIEVMNEAKELLSEYTFKKDSHEDRGFTFNRRSLSDARPPTQR